MATFVTLEDFQTRYGSTIPETDVNRVNALLDDVCAMITDLVGETYAQGEAPQAMIGVACTAARRAYENPQGLTGETIGSYSWQGKGSLYLTFEEQRVVLRSAGRGNVSSALMQTDLVIAADEQYLETDEGDPVLYFDQEDMG